MSKTCKTNKDVATAIKNKENEIIIEGDLGKKILRIKAVGPVAWGVCATALAAAIALAIAIPPTVAVPPAAPAAGAEAVVASFAMVPVATILGPAVTTAISIGVCAGGIGAVNALRDKYKITERTDYYIKLKRK